MNHGLAVMSLCIVGAPLIGALSGLERSIHRSPAGFPQP